MVGISEVLTACKKVKVHERTCKRKATTRAYFMTQCLYSSEDLTSLQNFITQSQPYHDACHAKSSPPSQLQNLGCMVDLVLTAHSSEPHTLLQTPSQNLPSSQNPQGPRVHSTDVFLVPRFRSIILWSCTSLLLFRAPFKSGLFYLT